MSKSITDSLSLPGAPKLQVASWAEPSSLLLYKYIY